MKYASDYVISNAKSFLSRFRRRTRAGRLRSGDVLYFWHVPKTSGMSFASLLASQFPDASCSPHLLWDNAIRMPTEELAGYQIIWGHLHGYIENYLRPHLDKPLLKVTMLRDPVARSISHYRHVCRDPKHPSHRKAQGMSIAEFVHDADMRRMIWNYQARNFVDFGWDPIRALKETKHLSAESLPLQSQASDSGLGMDMPEDELFERALEALRQCIFVGITERFYDSVRLLERTFGRCISRKDVRINVDSMPIQANQLDPTLLEELRRATAVDRRLHDWALNRLQQTLAMQ